VKRRPAEESSLNVDFGMPRSLADSNVRGLNLQIPELVAFWQLAVVNDWILFGIWLTVLHRHGEQALRGKGILNARGSATPVVIHGAQHVVHPPLHLVGWPDPERASRIPVIAQGLSEARLRKSLAGFLAPEGLLADS